MDIISPSFEPGGFIPDKFTCVGENVNPELHIDDVPAEAGSLALIMDDPDASRGITFNHWLLWNIPPETKIISENSVPDGAVEGKADFGGNKYGGPCPPPGKPHHYRFKIYALKEKLDAPEDISIEDLMESIDKNLIAKGELVGVYEKK